MVSIPRTPGARPRTLFRLLLWPAAPLATAVLLLVLYHNWEQGRVILALLMVLNLAWAVVASRGPLATLAGESGYPAVLVACLLGSVLLAEYLFPLWAPREFASLMELSKPFLGLEKEELRKYPVVFENGDQRVKVTQAWEEGQKGKYRFWHQPGKYMEYFGYEPNGKFGYVNLVRWNSLGYFDHDYPLEKPAGVYRIVVIGDSYVESIQVPLHKTFHKLLEAFLNDRRSGEGSARHEVIALGNSGTGQRENRRVLESTGVKFSPELVLMTLSTNDFCDDDSHLTEELALVGGQMGPLCRGLVRHGLYALAWAGRRVEEIRRNRIQVSPELLQWSADAVPRVEHAWSRTLEKIGESRDFCQASGIGFALIYLGSDLEVRCGIDPEGTIDALKSMGGPHRVIRWDLTRSIDRVTAFCRERGIPIVSLVGPLTDAQKQSGQKVFGDHFTMFGHETVAEVLGRWADTK
ncbi:MAG: hypothetical protein AB1646_22055 [Thermodesulfobacteriota bacterium]